MTLSKRTIQPIVTKSGKLAAGANVTIDVPIPNNSMCRLQADVLLVGSSDAAVDECAGLPAEIVVKNASGTVTAVTAVSGSANPQNSASAGALAARAVASELNAAVSNNPSTAAWSISSTNARLTITNNSGGEACEYDVLIVAHHISYQLTPSDLALAAWYRGDKGVVTVGSGSVSVEGWNDSSGSGDTNKNLIQATAAKQPTLLHQDPLYNNQPTISFDKTANQYLASGTWVTPQAQPFTVFVVGNDDGTANNQTYWSGVSSLVYFFQVAGAFYEFQAGAGLVDGTTPTSNPRIVACIGNGGSSKIYDTAKTAVATGAAGAVGIQDLALGIIDDLISDPLNGKIAEVIVVNAALDNAETVAILEFLSNKYGIALGA